MNKKIISAIGILVVVAILAVVYVTWEDAAPETSTEGELMTSPTRLSTSTDGLSGTSSIPLLPLTDSDVQKEETEAETIITDEVDMGELRIYTIKAEESKFVPNEIVVDKGDRIQINLIAVGGPRSFVISEPLSLSLDVKEDRPVTFGFDATTEGRYQFSDIEGNATGMIIVR